MQTVSLFHSINLLKIFLHCLVVDVLWCAWSEECRGGYGREGGRGRGREGERGRGREGEREGGVGEVSCYMAINETTFHMTTIPPLNDDLNVSGFTIT